MSAEPGDSTSSGFRVGALGVALCLLGGGFAAQALYVAGIGLVALALLAEGSVRLARRRGRVTLEPRTARVEEGESLQLTVRLGGWRVPLGGGDVEVPGVPATHRRPDRRRLEMTVRPRRRGPMVIGPPVVRYSDPFAICTRALYAQAAEVLVLPRVEPLRRSDIVRVAGVESYAGRHPRDLAATDVDGLRPYRRGTPASRIHWPTVARTGELHERRLQEDSERFPMVVLDAQRPASIDALDMAVRATASLCVGLARVGGCTLLLPGRQRAELLRADLAAWPDLHEQLALLEAGGAPWWRAAERATIVLWVSARRPEARAGRLRTAACYTVSPIPAHRGAVLLAVAGCAVQPLATRALAGAA